MTDKNNIEELFRNTLEGFESDVNPELWSKIEAGISPNTVNMPGSEALAGKSAITSWIVGSVAVISVVVVSTYYILKPQPEKPVIQYEPPVVSINQNNDLTSETDKVVSEIENKAPFQLSEAPARVSQTTVFKKAADKLVVPVSEPANQASIEHREKSIASNQDLDKIESKVTQTNSQENSASDLSDKSSVNNTTPDDVKNHQVEQNTSSNSNPPDDETVQTVKEEKTIEHYFGKLPNAFTPNGDGINDIFMVKPVDMKSFTVTIFDRSGKLIHSWNSPFGFWDGLLKGGQKAGEGTYFYTIVGESNEGTSIKKKGTMTLKTE